MSSIHWLMNVQYSEGGPIIAAQVENEYGSYATDEEYMPFIKEVRDQLFTSVSTVTARCPSLTHSPFSICQRTIDSNISERTSTVLFNNPPIPGFIVKGYDRAAADLRRQGWTEPRRSERRYCQIG